MKPRKELNSFLIFIVGNQDESMEIWPLQDSIFFFSPQGNRLRFDVFFLSSDEFRIRLKIIRN